MSRKTVIGRSDILSLDLDWDDGEVPPPETRRKAALLGFEYVPQLTKPEAAGPFIPDDPGEEPTTQSVGTGGQTKLAAIPFWCPLSLELLPDKDTDTGTGLDPDASPFWENKPKRPPQFRHFSENKLLEKQLRPFIAPLAKLRRIDIPKAVQKLASGQHLDKLPKRHKRKPAPCLQVVLDRSAHLIPFWTMQIEILHWLAIQDFGEVRLYSYTGADGGFLSERGGQFTSAPPNPEDGPLLVLGDLGVWSGERQECAPTWSVLARRFCQSGGKPFVFFPGPVEACPYDIKRLWQIVPAEIRQNTVWPFDPVKRLLTLASPVVRLEPGLLSHLRKALIPDAGISLDIAAWNEPVIEQPSSVAASWSREKIRTYRHAFARLPDKTQKSALSIIRNWRWNLPDEIYFEELLNLPSATKAWVRQDGALAEDFANALAHFEDIGQKLTANPTGQGNNLQAWLLNVGDRAADAWQEEPLRDAVMQIRRQADPGAMAPVAPDKIERPGVDVGAVNLAISPTGLDITVPESATSQTASSPLATLPSKNGVVDLVEWRAANEFPAEEFRLSGGAPGWAEDWGVDQFGPWAAFSLLFDLPEASDARRSSSEKMRVTQVMRWIPPGTFLMGSPEDEQGRYDDEGPQHERTIETGFWLFDTPVMQALWLAVMEDNPSEFKGLERPVESVSWDHAKAFIERLNERLPDLDMRLPSEAEWEYACRAGTAEATYAGGWSSDDDGADLAILGQIAWYRENSDNQTHPVSQKRPNDFGLYDMLGNVDEWCEDEWHDSYEGAPSDGSAWLGQPSGQDEKGRAYRVFRGGSWGVNALDVRSAVRNWNGPSGRGDYLGVRCAGGRVEPGRQGARSAQVSREPGKARTTTRVRSRVERAGAQPGGILGTEPAERTARKRAAVDPSHPQANLSLDALPARPMQICTDKAVLTLAPMTRPDWASAFGRDRFGLYADLLIEGVIQKLRWIPPGRFMMGAPDNEPGRSEPEGPQHEVTIGTGFWLFDTPVTQALWDVLMEKKNPSRFVHPERPVEQVDWFQAGEFTERLSERVPALMFDLPSEAEWEYACRAGTSAATYAGPMEILGANNAPVLDEIAWYGGNSGRDFDLDNGYDTSDWKDKQYPDDKQAGTRIVKQKKPNTFGLYDMLGNVWEWCQDEWHDSYEGAPDDGSAWSGQFSRQDRERRAGRVFRGGSWRDSAQVVRSACRTGYEPSDRGSNLGFRCAGGPVELRQAARSAKEGLAGDARAEPRGSGQAGAGQREQSGEFQLSDSGKPSGTGKRGDFERGNNTPNEDAP